MTTWVRCRHSVLKLLLAHNCHSYCCRRYEFRYSLPELVTRPQFRNADLLLRFLAAYHWGRADKNFPPKPEVWMNVVTKGGSSGRKLLTKVWGRNQHCHREKADKNFPPKSELWMNVVTWGYVRSTVRKKRASLKGGSLELRIAGSMKKI